jgi:hypothetical protein
MSEPVMPSEPEWARAVRYWRLRTGIGFAKLAIWGALEIVRGLLRYRADVGEAPDVQRDSAAGLRKR